MASSLLFASSSCAISFAAHIKNFDGLRASAPSSFLPRYGSTESSQPSKALVVQAAINSPKLEGRNLCITVIGGGHVGGCATKTLAKGGIETFLIKRKLDNAKPCGGVIPICIVHREEKGWVHMEPMELTTAVSQ